MSKSEICSVGPYTLEETLGRGQTGLVKLGLHCTTKKKVAVKIIDRSKLSEQVLSKVEREIAIMKLIEHPHVMGLYDVYENKRHLFLVLEHVSGGELFDYLVKKGRLPIGETRRYFAQITSAVDFCHKHCVCHRDLKPENLLLDKKMNIKVADFGMASLQAGDNALLETSCGSPHYACPEVIRGEKYDGRKADIWSCGIILYALLVGALPFDDENLRHLLEKVKRGHFKIPNFIPPDLQHLIKGMITVNPEKRLTMEEVRKHPFLSCCREELPLTPHGVDVIKTDVINSKGEIDPDVLDCMSSLGCFKNKDQLIKNLLKEERTMERVIYFLLLERKERIPCSEDQEVASMKNLKELLEDPPRKRVDTCGSPRLLRVRPLVSPNASPLSRPRAETVTGASSHRSPLIHVSPKHQLYVPINQGSPDPSPPESPSHSGTPPGSPWKSRFSNIKNAIVGSPRFHRKKYTHSADDSDPVSHHSPESSPDLVRRSWFGHLMIPHSVHKHEPFFIVMKERPFNIVKADVVHAFLSVSHLTHCVVSQNSFRAEYKKIGDKRMFKKAVKVIVEITSVDKDLGKENLVHTISITLEAGPAHRFKRLCEKLQTILFSDMRKILADERRRESEEKSPTDERDSSSGTLQLTHLSDTDSEGEL